MNKLMIFCDGFAIATVLFCEVGSKALPVAVSYLLASIIFDLYRMYTGRETK